MLKLTQQINIRPLDLSDERVVSFRPLDYVGQGASFRVLLIATLQPELNIFKVFNSKPDPSWSTINLPHYSVFRDS